MGDPIINAQVDDINTTLGNIKVDLAALRPSIRAIKDAIAETYLTDTIENVPIASFSDGADEIPVRELQVAIEPIQSGSGDPSPSNIRPISGHTEVNIHVADGETPHIVDNIYPISLGQTVYGGTLNVTTGVLTIDRVTETFTSFTGQVENNGFRTGQSVSLRPKSSYPELICNIFSRATNYNNATGTTGNGNRIGMNGSGLILLCAKDNDGWVTNINDLNALIPQEGCQICYEIETPLTVQLTAAEIETLFGQNNVWADTNGNIVKLTYRKAWEIALAQGE